MLQPGKPKLSGEMVKTFLSSFVVFMLLCAALIRARYRIGVLRDLVRARQGGRRRMIDTVVPFMIAAYVSRRCCPCRVLGDAVAPRQARIASGLESRRRG